MIREVTAQPADKPKVFEEELSQEVENLDRHFLECATEASSAEPTEEPDATIEIAVPPNQTEIEDEDELF
jgi:hypothetical protein